MSTRDRVTSKGETNPGGGAGRARSDLNRATIEAMHEASRKSGKAAIAKVIKQQPAVFLKLLVLLVPREMEVTHKGGVKAMTDEQIESAIEAIQAMLAQRGAGDNAKVVEGVAEPVVLPAPARKTKRKERKSDQVVGPFLGTDGESGNS